MKKLVTKVVKKVVKKVRKQVKIDHDPRKLITRIEIKRN